MDMKNYTCATCAFARRGKVIDDYDFTTKRHPVRDTLLCTLNPPTASAGRPETHEELVCAFYTDADGDQPLRRLVEEVAR